MSIFWKFVAIFAVMWLIWYWTGGPERSVGGKPYVKYDYNTSAFNGSDINLETDARDMLPVNNLQDGSQVIKDNLDNQNFVR